MNLINLTPHSIDIYKEESFLNLEKSGPTTWIADGIVDGVKPIKAITSTGVARIQTSTVSKPDLMGIPIVATEYGEAIRSDARTSQGRETAIGRIEGVGLHGAVLLDFSASAGRYSR